MRIKKATTYSFKNNLQRIRPPCGVAAKVLLSALLLLPAACVPGGEGGTGTLRVEDPEGGDDYILQEFEMDDAHLELDAANSPVVVKPSLAYWIKRDDEIHPRWDSLETHWQRVDKSPPCSFPDDNTPVSTDGDCLVCDMCLDSVQAPGGTGGRPCLGVLPDFSENFISVLSYSGFLPTDNPASVLSLTVNNVFGACANNTNWSVPTFTPQTSALYRIGSLQREKIIPRGDADGEAKIHVIRSGDTDTVAYKLTRMTTAEGTDYWTWRMPGEPYWLENFSPNLRVTSIRIVRGDCVNDPNLAKCVAPDTNPPVKPSRILFLPNFENTVSGNNQERRNRCYSHPTAFEGSYINLLQCKSDPTPQASLTQRIVTPAFDPDNPAVMESSLQKLMWLVHFDTNEGADADPITPGTNDAMPPHAVLTIVFTLEAV